MEKQLNYDIMKFAAKGIGYMGHPTRLRILEFLDVYGASSVSAIAKGIGEEQLLVSQSLKKLRDVDLVKTERKGIFVYYRLSGEYPASVFVCLRKLFGYITNNFNFLQDGVKALLPQDFTMLAANQIKLFAHVDKMRILEYLTLKDKACVTDIVNAVGLEQIKVSQYLKKLRDDGFVKSEREGRFIYYNITKGVHKTAVQCIRHKFLEQA